LEIAIAALRAVRTGDIALLASLLRQHPGLVSEQVNGTRTPLHVAADCPVRFPAGPASVGLVIRAAADPDAVVTDRMHAETPLPWPASSDDADVAEALIRAAPTLGHPRRVDGYSDRCGTGHSAQERHYLAAGWGAVSDRPDPAAEADPARLLVRATGRAGKLDPFKPWINRRWNEGLTNAAALHAEITAQGWPGRRALAPPRREGKGRWV
jgi:hypothetical protein